MGLMAASSSALIETLLATVDLSQHSVALPPGAVGVGLQVWCFGGALACEGTPSAPLLRQPCGRGRSRPLACQAPSQLGFVLPSRPGAPSREWTDPWAESGGPVASALSSPGLHLKGVPPDISGMWGTDTLLSAAFSPEQVRLSPPQGAAGQIPEKGGWGLFCHSCLLVAQRSFDSL